MVGGLACGEVAGNGYCLHALIIKSVAFCMCDVGIADAVCMRRLLLTLTLTYTPVLDTHSTSAPQYGNTPLPGANVLQLRSVSMLTGSIFCVLLSSILCLGFDLYMFTYG